MLEMMTLLTSRRAFAGVALLGALLAACSSPAIPAARISAGDRKVAPDFTLMEANDRPVRLSDYKGKVVLLNFWATWCGPCKMEIPWFIEFERVYKDRGFVMLGVSMDEDGWQAVRPFMKQKAINYSVVMGNDKVAQLYGGIESLPSTFLIDRDGRIAFAHSGLVGKHDYEVEILQLITQ
jgi:peroxiredoxin